MCGIGGIWQISGKRIISRERLEACGYAMSHRGPDGEGLFLSGNLALCHRRLAIIDTSTRAAQPMLVNCPVAKRKLRIVFNGEIYNYRELKVILEQLGHVFKSDSDTEVIVHAFEQWGTGSFEKLRGMFAFALWDEHKKILYLVRDRFGIKSLYYAKQDGYIAFASEIRSLKKLMNTAPGVRSGAIYEFLRQGYILQPETFYDGVKMLDPGSFLEISGHGLRQETFFDVASYYIKEKSSFSFEDATRQLHGVLQDSVRHHMRADVPVGLFLSGGVDSTALLVGLHEQGFGNVRTVSAVFPDTVYDESSSIHALADLCGTDHTDVPISGQDFVIFLDRLFEHMDQPTSDGVNTFFVSLAAKQAGLRVVLSGLGGDELFGGYPSFYDVPRLMAGQPLLRALNAVGGFSLGRRLSFTYSKSEKLREMAVAGSPYEAWRIYRSLFSDSQINSLIPGVIGSASVVASERRGPGRSLRSNISYYELSSYMKDQLLRDSDVFSMAHSIELRVPFVDDFMAKFSIALPDAYKMSGRNHKKILREIIRTVVPSSILDAPKKGFVLPIAEWMRHEAKDFIWEELGSSQVFAPAVVQDMLGRFAHKKLHWSRIWSLFVLNRFLSGSV